MPGILVLAHGGGKPAPTLEGRAALERGAVLIQEVTVHPDGDGHLVVELHRAHEKVVDPERADELLENAGPWGAPRPLLAQKAELVRGTF